MIVVFRRYTECCTYFQTKNEFQFESETDTEVIPKLLKMINDSRKDDDLTFRELVERAVQQLVSRC